ncbi:hypothetical protein LPA44_15995 [Halobacterium sp. KA-4]|jgi:hypothetical protein|uniref:sigma-70 region 4 domain-containing protein n=1 Tax=Halobacterium sp. KA-4 TaxID=2896367 RepID=UPI001E426B9F|nr:sigma factor-like helix-turn-helix DNA-binding protein [Halobacterium sp. KA-4]MCD2201373.1 hypothetical protein [Halobacterium sp. KA-4]
MSVKSSPADIIPSVPHTKDHGNPPIIQPAEQRDRDDDDEPAPRLIYIGEYAAKSAYYSPLRKSVMLGSVHGEKFTEDSFLEAPDAEELDEHIEQFVDTATAHNVEYTLSDQAFGLLIAKRLADAEAMPKGQAQAYILRDFLDISRQNTATILGSTPSTVDTQLRAGREKVERAALLTQNLTALQDDY